MRFYSTFLPLLSVASRCDEEDPSKGASLNLLQLRSAAPGGPLRLAQWAAEPCKPWCRQGDASWTMKCTWKNCKGCNACWEPSKPSVGASMTNSRCAKPIECADYDSNDCAAEWRNANANRALDAFYNRCCTEPGSNALRSRCSKCCPDPGPTAEPTAEPTAAPTAPPTAAPTASPTAAPTTAAPTASPTASPTSAPTATPTTAPPTASPTAPPTAAPTAAPTTAAPTALPTAAPTVPPTASPTAPPTAAPTTEPTPQPTSQPAPQPTPKPTLEPAQPTVHPTQPTVHPTQPTFQPTQPTVKPTLEPFQPSVHPMTTTTPTTSSTEDEEFIEFEFDPPAPHPTPAGTTTTPTTSSTEEEEFIEFQFDPPVPKPGPEPKPGAIEECCDGEVDGEVEEDAVSGTCSTTIAHLSLDSLHARDWGTMNETLFGDNVHMSNFKYYLESCDEFTGDCTYTLLADPDPQHHKFHVGKTRIKIEAYDISGNMYACMRNVYVHDMQPPSFVFRDPQVDSETQEIHRKPFIPNSLSVRLEVDKRTCNVLASEAFSRYESLQGVTGSSLQGLDNCDKQTEVVKKIYDLHANLLYDSSSAEFSSETQLTAGPGHYKMEIIAIDDYSDDIDFPSNRSRDMHRTSLHVDLELFDEEPPSGVSSCPADMTGDKEVLIDPDETEAVVYWDPPNVTFDNCQHHKPAPDPTCVVDTKGDGVCRPGMTLHVGTHVVIYSFQDAYGNPPGGIECEFRIHIVQREHPVKLTCPDDILIKTLPMREFAIVNWNDPVAMQNGKKLPQSHISYPQGVTPGMPFHFGVTEITVRAEGHDYAAVQQGHQVQQWDECTFIVTVTDEENPQCDGREFRCNDHDKAVNPAMLKPYDICGGPILEIQHRPGYATSFGYNTLGVSEASGSCCTSEMDVSHACTSIKGTGTSYCAPHDS